MESLIQGIPNWDCNKNVAINQECSFFLCVGGYAFVGTTLQVLEI